MTINCVHIWYGAIVFGLLTPVVAAAVTFVEQPDPFTLTYWEEEDVIGTQYGELTGFAHTFVFYNQATSTFSVAAATQPAAPDMSLLLVHELERGVTEVDRQTAGTVERDLRNGRYGINLLFTPTLEMTLKPGFYRLEVSNPDNTGRYQLIIGETQTTGYWQTVKDTFAVHAFYGSWWSALLTWRVMLLWVPITLFILWRMFRKRSQKPVDTTLQDNVERH